MASAQRILRLVEMRVRRYLHQMETWNTNVRELAFSAAARAVARNDTKLARTLLTHDVTVRPFLAVVDRTVDSSSLAPLPRKGVNHEKKLTTTTTTTVAGKKIDKHNELSHPIRPYQYSVK